MSVYDIIIYAIIYTRFYGQEDILARHGFIRDDKDIKYLILYGLSFMTMPISETDLLEIIMVDEGFGYFDFSPAFSDLQKTGMITCHSSERGELYSLSSRGAAVNDAMHTLLPLPVREKAEREAMKLAAKLRNSSAVRAYHEENPDGTFNVILKIMDNETVMASLQMMMFSPEQCQLVEDNFRKNAQNIYKEMIDLLVADPKVF